MMKDQKQRRRVILVTGMSGAGHSTALKILEDLGYEAVDNLPLALLDPLIKLTQSIPSTSPHHLVIGIDTRAYDFDPVRFKSYLDAIEGVDLTVLFLDCDQEILLRRFTETRRRHPLGNSSLKTAIEQERQLLAPLKSIADEDIDTSELSVMGFARLLRGKFSLEKSPQLTISITSFSYKKGLPREADMVFDARFLMNPFYDTRLKDLTGQDTAVAAFLLQDEHWSSSFKALTTLLHTTLTGFKTIGRSYVTIACGCTGGQHRSVFIAEQLKAWLEREGEKVVVSHRELL